MSIFYPYLSDTILLEENAHSNIMDANASDVIDLAELAETNIIFCSASDELVLLGRAKANFSLGLSVNESLVLIEKAKPRVYLCDTADVVVLEESNIDKIALDYIQLVELAQAIQSNGIKDLMVLDEELIVHFSKKTVNLDQIVLRESAVGYKLDTCIVASQINSGHVTYSHAGLGLSIELPSPDFDNVEQFNFTRINSETRGGDIIVFRDINWPKNQTLVYSWNSLDKKDKIKFIGFLKQTIGKLITLVDYENRTFIGVIKNPDTDFVDSSIVGYSVQIEFEVE